MDGSNKEGLRKIGKMEFRIVIIGEQ